MGASPNPLGSLAAPSGTKLATEPISGNSLTQFIRSIEGLTGQQGQGILGAGLGTAQQGTTAIAPALSFLTNLVQGNQADITQAAQPQIDQITQQFDAIRNLISLAPRGGGKTTALAEAPFQKAGDIQRTEGSMRTGAAGQLGSLGTTLAGLGLQQAGLGTGLEGEAASLALGKEGQDYGQQSTLQQALSAANAGANVLTALL